MAWQLSGNAADEALRQALAANALPAAALAALWPALPTPAPRADAAPAQRPGWPPPARCRARRC